MRTPLRLAAAIALAAAGLVLAAAPVRLAAETQPPLHARIKIDTDRVIGDVDPLLFGSFAEHLGRMVYGGIYDEGSPLSDADGFRTDVMQAVKDLGVTILRWPGGNFVSGYHWKDGLGPKSLRPVRLDLAWNAVESNRFGTDEFLKYTEKIGAEPYIAVNLGLGTIDEARDWVEYTNEARPTWWASERRKNGHPAPYGVKYWGLGNEMDGPWQLGHKPADEYARFALEAAKAMRGVDDSIKLVASGSSNYGADWVGWNRTVLTTLRNEIDYIAIHTYISNRDNDFEKYMAWSQTIDRYIETTAALIKEVRGGRANARPIAIAYDEWNVWYRAGVKEGLEERYNFEDALAMGLFFNSFFRHADVVKMANLAQMVNVIAPIMTSKDGLFLQPTYFPIVEYGKQRGNRALDVWVSAPTYTPAENRAPLPYLDVSATYDAKGKQIFLNVLNRSKDRDIATRIDNQEGRLTGELAVWQMNHDDLKATNDFGDDHKVRPVTRTETVAVRGGGFTFTFPAHSLTMLRMTLE